MECIEIMKSVSKTLIGVFKVMIYIINFLFIMNKYIIVASKLIELINKLFIKYFQVYFPWEEVNSLQHKDLIDKT